VVSDRHQNLKPDLDHASGVRGQPAAEVGLHEEALTAGDQCDVRNQVQLKQRRLLTLCLLRSIEGADPEAGDALRLVAVEQRDALCKRRQRR
jgi:hypothetical protein